MVVSFDTIPHAELMRSVARRVSDRHMLHLIKMWLEAPVEETDDLAADLAGCTGNQYPHQSAWYSGSEGLSASRGLSRSLSESR